MTSGLVLLASAVALGLIWRGIAHARRAPAAAAAGPAAA